MSDSRGERERKKEKRKKKERKKKERKKERKKKRKKEKPEGAIGAWTTESSVIRKDKVSYRLHHHHHHHTTHTKTYIYIFTHSLHFSIKHVYPTSQTRISSNHFSSHVIRLTCWNGGYGRSIACWQ